MSAEAGLLKRALLKRTEESDEGTSGILIAGTQVYHTLELPNRNNKPCRSRIRPGTYDCSLTYSPRYRKRTYQLHKVTGRWWIRIHSGNTAGDTKKGKRSDVLGCIILGLRKGRLYGQKAVLASRKAVSQFERLMAGQPFKITILPED